MKAIEYLNENIKVIVDRKMGSKHPQYGFLYPVNYGFVSNTISDDEEKFDCYVLGVFEPIDEFEGICIAVVHRFNDNDKLIVAPINRDFSNKEIEVLIEFQERFFRHEIIRNDIEFNSLIPELSVSNIEISKEFYFNLGFKIKYERPESKFCFLQLEENQIMIEEENDHWNTGKMEYPYGRGINISMTIQNIEDKYKEYRNKGVAFFLELEVHEYRINDKIAADKEFLIQDPDGYLLRFNN